MKFSGSDSINLDAKGRLAIPTRYRDALLEFCQGEMVIATELNAKCLTLSPKPHWDVFAESIARLPALDPMGEMMSRFIIGRAKEVTVDGSGRVLIPNELRAHAGLDKKLIVVGRTERLEIWDEEAWYEAEREMIAQYQKALQQARDSGSAIYNGLGWSK